MEDTILRHLELYPHCEMQDVIKLVYQAEFGCSHLMKDRQTAERYLNSELDHCGEPRENEALYEPIGEGLCRLNLRPALKKLSREEILMLFIHCASQKRGSSDGFRSRIRQLYKLCETERIPFEPVEIDVFLSTYSMKRCTPLSHSVRYSTLYHPAYRLVNQKELKDLLKARRLIQTEG